MTLTLTNRLFNEVFSNWNDSFFEESYPYLERQSERELEHHNGEDYREVYVPLAGFKREHIKAEVNDETISIIAKRDKNVATYSFVFPDDADLSTVSSKLEDGLLTVKVEKKTKAKAIKIKIT
tara:strand:- start:65 stop:433 length:369 start_codon:yes stop_codon:yes gene_type:complete